MRKIITAIVLLISIQSYGQIYKLYAIKGNLDGSRDSFYVKIFNDSIFDKNNQYTLRTKEYYERFYDPVFPLSFGQFFQCADNVWRNGIALFGVKTETVTIHSDAGVNLPLTDHPNSEQPLANSQRSSVRVQTHGYTEARLTAIVIQNSASVNSPRLYFQYSTDGSNWVGDGSVNISLTTNGAKETAWVALPAGAIGDVYIRVAMNGGNGSADPSLGNVTIQFR